MFVYMCVYIIYLYKYISFKYKYIYSSLWHHLQLQMLTQLHGLSTHVLVSIHLMYRKTIVCLVMLTLPCIWRLLLFYLCDYSIMFLANRLYYKGGYVLRDLPKILQEE